jgi:PelA/Pel-15E family pectate lyase
MPIHSRTLVSGFATIALALSSPGDAAAQVRWSSDLLGRHRDWYASAEARAIADNVLRYQSPQGGWPKSTNLAVAPATPADVPVQGDGRANSFDNDATTVPMEFLARVVEAAGESRHRASFLRGVDYLLAAQYANGGWPQFWPLRGGYHDRITYNDDAMIRVMSLLRDVAAGAGPYGFVDATRRGRADAAVRRGIDVILKTQVRQGGRLTAWCAQHDERTLAPAWARAYEPPSLSGGESVGIVRFLMSIERPTPEVIAAVEGAVSWLRSVPIEGMRVERIARAGGRPERVLVPDPAAPPLWARFYELGTNRPLYLDRDSRFRYDFREIGYERRSGYNYHGTWPARLLDEEYPAWRAKLSLVGPARRRGR